MLQTLAPGLTIFRQQVRTGIINWGREFQCTMTYKDLAGQIGFTGLLHYLAYPLGDVSLDCHRRGEPLFSAIVVNEATGKPGNGFWSMVRSIYRVLPSDQDMFLNNMQTSVLRYLDVP